MRPTRQLRGAASPRRQTRTLRRAGSQVSCCGPRRAASKRTCSSLASRQHPAAPALTRTGACPRSRERVRLVFRGSRRPSYTPRASAQAALGREHGGTVSRWRQHALSGGDALGRLVPRRQKDAGASRHYRPAAERGTGANGCARMRAGILRPAGQCHHAVWTSADQREAVSGCARLVPAHLLARQRRDMLTCLHCRRLRERVRAGRVSGHLGVGAAARDAAYVPSRARARAQPLQAQRKESSRGRGIRSACCGRRCQLVRRGPGAHQYHHQPTRQLHRARVRARARAHSACRT